MVWWQWREKSWTHPGYVCIWIVGHFEFLHSSTAPVYFILFTCLLFLFICLHSMTAWLNFHSTVFHHKIWMNDLHLPASTLVVETQSKIKLLKFVFITVQLLFVCLFVLLIYSIIRALCYFQNKIPLEFNMTVRHTGYIWNKYICSIT